MRILVVDDEPIDLELEAGLIRQCAPQAEVLAFSSGPEALAWLGKDEAEVVFLDQRMPDCSGVTLARRMKQLWPRLNIIFATAHADCYAQAMQLRASGYLLKPLKAEAVLEELENLRYPVMQTRLFVQAFGTFEVFFNGEPVMFRYLKTKELFAYLIDRRGALVSRDELITVLWGGETERSSYYKQVQKDLTDTLSRLDCRDVLVKQRGVLGLACAKLRCDYYAWLRGDPAGLSAFHGEYMRQYDWAEPTQVNLRRDGGYTEDVLD